MHVSSAIVIAVVAALASSTSAKPAAAPDTAGADGCPVFCLFDPQCAQCTGHTHCIGIFCAVSHVPILNIGAV
ncbi:hypothetical protein CY34DRAFT_811682 [Suillus luteus UH-Slu-Lm8-n1]|uniref:Unplaced genomic scaffold CY34scaffold_439, whole genome shotgun sequence n=1 Tax=Suillus luteus UH-Slu-Lm8-n1 TaxID=930992 RepID=A0A0D0ANX2_9AGAM|nr:hypothetical protein CY34DRAFT_811682 [Suillus luteus UH-Slu-Lm8-n1]